MRPRWRKVLLDLIENKGRTILVVFSIAVGVFSVGVILGAYVIIQNDMSASYAANKPANIEMRLDEFDENLLTTVRNFHGIEEAEGRRVFNVHVRTKNGKQWVSVDMVAIEDFEENTLNLLNPVSGLTFPEKRQIVVERDLLEDINLQAGDVLEIEVPGGLIKELPVVGIVQDPTTGADDFLASPLAYVTMSTLHYLGQPDTFNRIYASVEIGKDDDPHIRTVAGDLKDKIENNGYDVGTMNFSKTHEHPLAPTINAVLWILLALGVLIVFLSSSLIANTLSALLNQHLRHIGVMKLVGGRNHSIVAMYFVLMLAFGFMALLIAVPLGGRGAYWLAEFIAVNLSFTLLGYRIVPFAFGIQFVIGMLVPLVAGLAPVIRGSRVTVLRAISGEAAQESDKQDDNGDKRVSRWDTFQTRATEALARRGINIPRPLLISLRNTFRRRGRLFLTLFTLTMGGAIFIAVFNVRISLHDYIGSISNYFIADVTIDFDQPYRLKEIEQFAMQMDEVVYVEGWQFASGEILYPDEKVADNVSILAPPWDSELVQPMLVEGRWLRADDVRKMAISETILSYFPDLKTGDTLTMKINGKKEQWQIIGIFKFVGLQGVIAYAPYEYISETSNLVNRSYSYRIVTEQHTREYQDAMSETMDDYFRENGFKVREIQPGLSTLDSAVESLDILVTFLLIMALLTAVVGSIGLAGTMGMNVLERTREIGVMRAVGANNSAIMRTIIAEGVVVGGISWILAVILSFPFTLGLATIVSLAIFETPIKLVFTFTGYLIWLLLVLVLSAVSSILPARNAARLTIREVLAYE